MRVSRTARNVLSSAVMLAIAASARADAEVVALDALIAQSDAIVMGVVSRVTAIGAPGGAHLARIDVQQTFKGNRGASLELAGNSLHADDAMFVEGVRVLAFLRGARPIAGAAGIIEIADEGAARQAATIVGRALRNQRAPANYRDVFIRSGMRVPRPLLAALLEGLTARLTPRDSGLLVEAACDTGDSFLPAVRGWAIAQAGLRTFTDARGCLEAAAVSTTDTQFVAEALDALGDLGDVRSVPVLVTLVNDAIRAPQGAPRGRSGPLVGAVLALGKIGDANAVPTLVELARRGNDLALDATAVHALGLIGTSGAAQGLDTIGREHASQRIRDQARATLQQLGRSRPRRNP